MRVRLVVAAGVASVLTVAGCSGPGRAGRASSPSSTSGAANPFATPSARADASSSSSAVTARGGRPRGSLTPGECFDASTFSAGVPIDPATITLRLCAGPHQHEVFAVLAHPGNAAAPYPGDDTINAYANDRCIAAFTDYVGTPYRLSTLDYSTVQPTAQTWSSGDRQVACVLHDADFVPVTGTMKDSKR